jgi:hypothetical protein
MRARVNDGASVGHNHVMARAAIAERGRPRGSRCPFYTVDTASAVDRRRPVAAVACCRLGGSRRRAGQERSGLIELATAGGTPDSVIAHLPTSAREHMLEEAPEKLDAGARDPAKVLRPIVPIAERYLAVLDPFQCAVGEGDAKNVAAQIVEDLVAAPGGLAEHDPIR